MSATTNILSSFVATVGDSFSTEQMEFRIFEMDGDLYIRSFDSYGERGSSIFFERANLPEIIQAMEDYIDPVRRAGRKSIKVVHGKDNFGVSVATPNRFDLMVDIFSHREATIDGLKLRSWSMVIPLTTTERLIAELKKLL